MGTEQVTPAGATPVIQEPHGIEGLDPDAVLVFLRADGALVFYHPDGAVVQTGGTPTVSQVYGGLPNSQWMIGLTEGMVSITLHDPTGPGLLLVHPDGSTRLIPAPGFSGDLVNAHPSPDGSLIAWLYDATEVPPTMAEGCEPERSCIGRVYDLVTTDISGSNPTMIWHVVIEYPHPTLRISHWMAEGKSVLLHKVPYGVASALYPPDTNIASLEVSIPGGAVIERNTESVSMDGHWQAEAEWITFEGHSLKVKSVVGLTHSLLPEGEQPYAAQMTFSPANEYMVWVEFTYDSDSDVVDQINLKRLDLAAGAVSVLDRLDGIERGEDYQFDLPYTGSWLNDHLLAINYQTGSAILDTRDGRWVDWNRPESDEPLVLVGTVIAPEDSGQTQAAPTPEEQAGIPEAPLSDNGPWLLFSAEDGLWALNPDGSGLTHLTHEPLAAPRDLRAGISPSGHHLAFVTTTDKGNLTGLRLKLLSLPGGEVQEITPLTSPSTEPNPEDWGEDAWEKVTDPAYNAARAVTVGNGVAWSPDGSKLAFIGAFQVRSKVLPQTCTCITWKTRRSPN
jgi:hypothetical protein